VFVQFLEEDVEVGLFNGITIPELMESSSNGCPGKFLVLVVPVFIIQYLLSPCTVRLGKLKIKSVLGFNDE